MASADARQNSFPPGISGLPALLLGLAAAAVAVAVGVSVEPLSLLGHAITAGMLAQLVGEWRLLGSVAAQLPSSAEAGLSGWAERLARDCLGAEPNRLSDQDARHRLAECRDDMCRVLDLRWWAYFGAAGAVALLGLAAGLAALRASPNGRLLLDYREVFLPLTLATVEAVVVGLAAFFLRLEWEELLERWRELASAAGRRLPALASLAPRVESAQPATPAATAAAAAGRKRGRLTFRKSVAAPSAPPKPISDEDAPMVLTGGLPDLPPMPPEPDGMPAAEPTAEPTPEPAAEPTPAAPPVVRLVPRLEDDD